MKISQFIKVSAAIAAALTFGQVSAQTLTATGAVKGTSTYYGYNGSSSLGTYAPGREFTYNGSTFWAFCIDPATGTSLPNPYSTLSLASYLDGAADSEYALQMGRSGYSGFSGLSTSTATQSRVRDDLMELYSWAYNDAMSSATKAAAFGMAIWEIILQDGSSTGTTYSKASGRMNSYGSSTSNTSDAVDLQTNSYLTALNTGNWTGLLGASAAQTNWTYTVYFENIASGASQTFLRVTAPGTSVPEPATLALAGLGILGAVRFSRRNKKQA